MSEKILDAAALLAAAEAETGLSDYGGDASFTTRFGKAVDHLVGIGMNEAGQRAAASVCHWLLTSRLQLFEDRKRYPIGDEIIDRPMFATGEPRSGTTLMHALMSVDPDAQALRFWEVMYPSPPPGLAGPATHPRPGPMRTGARSTPRCPNGCTAIRTTTCSATACPRTSAAGRWIFAS